MKLNLLIVFLFIQLIAFSQKDSILINGIVTNTESKAIKNALVHLVSSQGSRYEYKTDSTGTYRFYFYTESSLSGTLTIASDKHTYYFRKKSQPGLCGFKRSGYFRIKARQYLREKFRTNGHYSL